MGIRREANKKPRSLHLEPFFLDVVELLKAAPACKTITNGVDRFFVSLRLTKMRDFIDRRQLTVYNKSDNQMKLEESPVGEFVTLHHKKSH